MPQWLLGGLNSSLLHLLAGRDCNGAALASRPWQAELGAHPTWFQHPISGMSGMSGMSQVPLSQALAQKIYPWCCTVHDARTLPIEVAQVPHGEAEVVECLLYLPHWHVRVQVARLMLKGMEEGRYVLRFPDFLSTWICAGLGGTGELCLPVLVTALIAPLVVSPLCHDLEAQLTSQRLQPDFHSIHQIGVDP